MKLYNRLDGVPQNHNYLLVRIISYGDFESPYEDEILASAEGYDELEQYCKLQNFTIHPGGWTEYKIRVVL